MPKHKNNALSAKLWKKFAYIKKKLYLCIRFQTLNSMARKSKQQEGGSGIRFDRHNFRLHSEANKKLIRESLEACGAGRSVLVDNEGELIAGNGVFEQAQALGIPVRVVESDGSELVVVKRTDLQTDDDKRKLLAGFDNVASDNVEWNVPEIRANLTAAQVEQLHIELPPVEISASPDEFGEEFTLPEGEKQPYQQMTFILHDEQAETIKAALAAVKETEEYKYCDTFGNSNHNGNAIYCLVQQWESARK